jgi:hypothetical protein
MLTNSCASGNAIQLLRLSPSNRTVTAPTDDMQRNAPGKAVRNADTINSGARLIIGAPLSLRIADTAWLKRDLGEAFAKIV